MTHTTDFELLFESAPISLWLEDYRQLKALFQRWRQQGVTDLLAHLQAHPHLAEECARCYQVIRVNRETLRVFAASSQEELLSRLPEVFRGDMFARMASELNHLWNGKLDFSARSVNYALDGRRIEVLMHVRVLEGFEDSWERVMVSLQDVTAHEHARQQLEVSEQHARNLFAFSPVSLWVEDFSGVKQLMDEVRASGIDDFRTFLNVHSEFVQRCMQKIVVHEVNQQTLRMFAAHHQDELLGKLDSVFRGEMEASFAEQLIDLWSGKLHQTREVVNYSLNGERINIHMQFAVMPGHEERWDLVLVSLVDITARKKAEAYLEYLGKHDALTKLRNRAFYVEELNRISRKGPWPLSVLAMDLNGLKQVNDTQGHTIGDSLLRRVGEVLQKASADMPACVARIGGDEFIALLPGSDERTALALKDRIESVMELNNQFYPGQKLSLSIGIASCQSAAEVEQCIQQADQQMYAQKKQFYEESQLERRKH